MEKLIVLLKELQYTLSSMESCTGGLFASELTGISGASAVFKGSLVSYANKIKEDVGNVGSCLITKHGVLSKEVALAMALNAQELFESDVAVSFTGNAGPNTLEGKPVGLVFSAMVVKEKTLVFEDYYQGKRNEIRKAIVKKTIERLLEILQEEKNG